MKIRKLLLLSSILMGTMTFSASCSFFGKSTNTTDFMSVGDIKEAKTFAKQKFFNFTQSQPLSMINASDGYSNNGAFGSTWSKSAVTYAESEGMSLNIEFTDDLNKIKSDSKDPFISAEVRTQNYYQYGYFGTTMKPSGVVGTASTFFLYSSEPHDEIDIEFLGKYHNKVQFNYFKNGVGGHEYWYDLGFDATQEFHQYGFYWDEHEITWYVDYQPVYRLVGDSPRAECQLLANCWVGSSADKGVMSWMGEADIDDFPTRAIYQKIEMADLNGNQIEKRPTGKEFEKPLTDADFVSAIGTLKDDSSNPYTLVNSGNNSFEFQWKKENIVKNYQNRKINFSNVANYCYVKFSVQNLETTHPTLMRVNMDSSGSSGTISNLILNLVKNGRTDSGQTDINSNTEAIFEINAGETATCQIEWYGAGVNEMTFMWDDFGKMPVVDGSGQRDGHVIIKDFKFAGRQQYEGPNQDDIVDELYDVYDDPAHQVAIPNDYTKFNTSFGSSEASAYKFDVKTVTEGVQIDYSVSANNYQGVYTGTSEFRGYSSVIFVIKNMNPKSETYRFLFRYRYYADPNNTSSYEKIYGVSNVEIMSNSSTGSIAKFKEGKADVTINGGRTCQIKIDYLGGNNIHDIAIVPAIAGSVSTGSFIINGTYKK